MSPKGLQRLTENLNDKQKQAIQEVGFNNFLHLEADKILEKPAVWLVHNFNASSYSILFTYGNMRVTKEYVYMRLCLPKGPLEAIKAENETDSSVEFKSLLKHWKDFQTKVIASSIPNVELEFKIESGKGYPADSLDKTVVTNKEEEVNEEEHSNKNFVPEAKALFQDSKVTTDKITTNSRLLAKVVIELEKFLPRARVPLKSVRKVVTKSISDTVIRDMPKKSKSRTPVLSPDSCQAEGFLMEIDAIEKHFVSSQIRCTNFHSSLYLVSALGSLKRRTKNY
ncbi:hypothetical protein Cgig2_028513 [Carnegiea gigantea]|uniref:Uncharacterized protein n=1 Tax=Carnegiea gigantea TaxID=171969 RepID=A0A9Q1JN30_9CARY|nr:hypothetical protein Cgig2_028513 [Carnegiea gigantea]